LNFVFTNIDEKKDNKKIADIFKISLNNKLNYKNLASFISSSDVFFVKSPENFLFLEILFFFRRDHTVLFYGGDIYQKRFLSSIKFKKGFENLTSYLEYLVYRNLEEVLWKNAFTCFSPNIEEKDFISNFNKRSLVLPIRVFSSFNKRDRDNLMALQKKETVELIFVGGSGHQPNIRALNANIEFFEKHLECLENPNYRINIVGRGWDNKDFNSIKFQSSRIIFHGQLDDKQLNELYERSLFSISLIKDGAGVKGKVIEAMHQQNIVITSEIGAQGIPNNVLPSFNKENELVKYIASIVLNEIDPCLVLKKYNNFLKEHYSIKTYENLFNQVNIYLNDENKIL
jgi:hypothetical protein